MLSVRPSRTPPRLSLYEARARAASYNTIGILRARRAGPQQLPSVLQFCGRRRGGARVISAASAAHQNGRPDPCQWQQRCPACRAAQCWPHNSMPLRVIEREVVRAGSAHIVCDLCTEHVGIAISVENDAWRVYWRWYLSGPPLWCSGRHLYTRYGAAVRRRPNSLGF